MAATVLGTPKAMLGAARQQALSQSTARSPVQEIVKVSAWSGPVWSVRALLRRNAVETAWSDDAPGGSDDGVRHHAPDRLSR
jgi:hypothetical protein